MEAFAHVREYFFWITLVVPFYMFGQTPNPTVRSDGSPKFAVASTLAAGCIPITPAPAARTGPEPWRPLR